MLDASPLHLDRFSQCAIQFDHGQVADLNQAARLLFPRLSAGAAVPACLNPALASGEAAGCVLVEGRTCYFTRLPLPRGELLLLEPAPQSRLTDDQLEGFLRQTRQFMADILLQVQCLSRQSGQEGADKAAHATAAFYQSFCRMFRLLGNLEYLWEAGGDGTPFHPVTMDLAGLCTKLCRECAPLLAQKGCRLALQSDAPSLLLPGDPDLLERMLLDLISNAAKAAPEGEITLRLHKGEGRALLTLNDSGPTPTEDQMAALFQLPVGQPVPAPGQGAGMGLSIVRHIVALHGGSFLARLEEGRGLVCAVSLPTDPLNGRMEVRTPQPQRDGGLSPLLVALSDVLPLSLYEAAEFQ